MVDNLAGALEELKRRGNHPARGDHAFVSRDGSPLDGSALRRRYIATRDAAGLRPLRFHDLRHTFASVAINVASITQVQAWMGHADVKTTMRYLHHKSRADDAQLLSKAFQPETCLNLPPNRGTRPPNHPHRRHEGASRRDRLTVGLGNPTV